MKCNEIKVKVATEFEPTNAQTLVNRLLTEQAFLELRAKMGPEFMGNLAMQIENAAVRDMEIVRRWSEASIANLSKAAERLSAICERLDADLRSTIDELSPTCTPIPKDAT